MNKIRFTIEVDFCGNVTVNDGRNRDGDPPPPPPPNGGGGEGDTGEIRPEEGNNSSLPDTTVDT